MEGSVASLAFKGSITEAIMEAKRQKKLFVVYISGDDEVSGRLENMTWIDTKVVESVLKYCILLHISQGSTEAVQFSAIYRQTSVPCITLIGYNGVQIWQNEGFVTAETLQSTIDKAWLSLHLQETTASILTAALASKKYEPSSSGTPIDGNQEDVSILKDRPVTEPVVVDKELGNKSGVENSTNSADTTPSDVRADMALAPKLETDDTTSIIRADMPLSPPLFDTTLSDDSANIAISPSLETVEEAPTIGDTKMSRCVEEKIISPEDKKNVTRNQANACEGTSSVVSRELRGPSCTEDAKTEGNGKVAAPKSNDVNLNIRLPNGTSLQQKFHMTSTLREVKAYVNENQASSISSYDLAIPYPRRVFSDQDLSLPLSELGLSNRQALIVVPHQQASGEPRVINFAREQTVNAADASSNANDEGYFSYLRRALSYFNPLSYIGGRPSSSSSEMGSEEYGANTGRQANLRGSGSTYAGYPQGQNKPEASSSNRKNKQPTNTRFGSNIHTLKRDEDDGRFENRNPFWNGNSTQYNGSGDNDDTK